MWRLLPILVMSPLFVAISWGVYLGAVDWARAKIPSLDQAIKSWLEAPPYLLVEERHPEASQKLFKLEINRRLPGTINACVGAIINSARTSLDLLASALAIRNGKTPSRERHFPIYDSVLDFIDPLNAAKRKKWLSSVEHKIIEELKPYDGGNDLLFALHHLDIMRKHERLISVHLVPTNIIVDPGAIQQGLQFPSRWPGFNDGAVIAWTHIDATNCQFQIPAEIQFAEANLLPNKPVIAALREFAGLADGIIQMFEAT